MTWRKCRKKPIVVEFRECTDEFLYDAGSDSYSKPETHYIMRGIMGEMYSITKEIFHKTYEVLEKEPQK